MSIDASAVARVLGITTQFKDLRNGAILNLPQRIAIFGQGSFDSVYALTKKQVTSHAQAGATYGYGSPIHLIARELFPDNGDGVGTIPVTVYPLDDGYDTGALRAAGSITPAGSQTKAAEYRVRVAGYLSDVFTIPVAASVAAVCDLIVAAINGVLHMPVTAMDNTTSVGLEAKWAGTSGNDIVVEMLGESLGTTFALVQPTGGTANPDMQDALDLVGIVWETLGINALNHNDTTALNAIQTWGEGRWGTLVRKPIAVVYGCTDDEVDDAIEFTDARPTDRVNCQLVAPGSPSLPCVVAARQLARIAVLANNNPPHDYGSQRATGLVPGDDAVQWTYAERDQAVKGGSSTSEVRDSVVTIADVVTPYAPEGEPIPAYRYLVDIVKLQNIIFNLDVIFANTEWDGAPFIPDDQPTTNKTAKKPKMAKLAANNMIDALGLAAIVSDPKTAKTKTTCQQDVGNPKRWNLEITVQLVCNSNIKDVTLSFGFFFGSAAVVA